MYFVKTHLLGYPVGLESTTGCSCIVSSPSLVKAAPAAEKISPTWKKKRKKKIVFFQGFFLQIITQQGEFICETSRGSLQGFF